MAEPPYPQIWDDLKDGLVIPFLGAGASGVGPHGKQWDPAQPDFLPSGTQLAGFLADKANFPSQDEYDRRDLAKVASYFVDVIDRRSLRRRMREVFDRDYAGSSLHDLLASVPANLLIVSTNYDVLIEHAFQRAGKPYDLIVYPADRFDLANGVLWWPHGASEPQDIDPRKLVIDIQRTSVIYKMHGSFHPAAAELDNYVITEDDYVEFLSRMTTRTAIPAFFYKYVRDRRFLFLGYSLRDWNIRVVLRKISRDLQAEFVRAKTGDDTVRHWAIQVNPPELERRLWSSRNVEIFDVPLDDFVARLSTLPDR